MVVSGIKGRVACQCTFQVSIMEFIRKEDNHYYGMAADSQNRKLDNGTCYWRCHKRPCAARITTWHRQQTNGHNHAVNPATTQVEEIKSKLRKRAIPETTCSTSEPV